MKLRRPSLLVLAISCLLFAGCQTTEAPPGQDADGTESTAERRKEGGSVRSSPFNPPVPSEVERADYRFW